MKYGVVPSEHVDKIFARLLKKNKKQLEIINKKVLEIQESPYHFKPLSGNMHGIRRVHIDKHFVLTYEIDEKNKTVKLLDYDHHENIYE